MFDELVKRGVIRCPETGEVLEKLEPWLYASSQSDHMYPLIGQTPVIHPDNDGFLETEILTISRALAQWPIDDEPREWYFSRYGGIAAPSAPDLDTAVRGEGYPGFWAQVDLPEFVRELVEHPPEDRLISWLSGERFTLGLDLGCGQGGMLQRMAELCEFAVGIEQNFYLAAMANRQLPAHEIPVRYLVPERGIRQEDLPKPPAENALVMCGDARALPFARESFDWIHCGHFLDLVDEPGDVILSLSQLLKPDGLLTICTPWDIEEEGHFDDMLPLLDELFEEFARDEGVPWLRFNHKRRFVLHEDWLWAGRRT